jgi:hypothetical protein
MAAPVEARPTTGRTRLSLPMVELVEARPTTARTPAEPADG